MLFAAPYLAPFALSLPLVLVMVEAKKRRLESSVQV